MPNIPRPAPSSRPAPKSRPSSSRAAPPSSKSVKALPELIVFGYAAPEASAEAKRRMTDLAIRLGKLAGTDVGMTALPSYERVAQLVHKGEIDLAWLSPIPFIALMRGKSVVPLVSQYRVGRNSYHGAIIVAASSRVRSPTGLKGKRAAWVDKHSASGFVLPRIQLAAMGVDPRTAFSGQRFYGSHQAVVKAVASGKADFGATYVQLGKQGAIADGPWTHVPGLGSSIRVLAIFGEIPSDVIAARGDLPAAGRDRLTRAFLQLAKDPKGKELVREVFGADDFRRPSVASYEELRNAAAGAVEDGLLDAGAGERGAAEASADKTQPIQVRRRADSTQEAEIIEVIEE